MNSQNKSLIESDLSYCMFGAVTISKLLKGFEAQVQGVRENKDIEYVHKMRVASRKLRATIPLFENCFQKKQYKKWLKEVKKATQLLGEARDLDVQIEFIKKYMDKLEKPTEKAGIESLLKDHKSRREKAQETVVKGLGELEASGVLAEIAGFCERTLKELAKAPFDVDAVLKDAYWHISTRIDDFVAMETYVHQQTQAAKHHEMRIKAKWLRYTMEAYSPLYKGQLDDKIEAVKEFQDVLGGMHDDEVWIAYIPRFWTKKAKNAKPKTFGAKQTFDNFLRYIKAQKRDGYGQFVQLWDKTKASGFFDSVRETINVGFKMNGKELEDAASKPNAKIAIISDIHANLYALQAVLEHAETRGAVAFLNAGDTIGYGAFPNQVVELLHTKNVVSIMGNYDVEVIKGTKKVGKGDKKKTFNFTKKSLAKTCQAYLLSFPPQFRMQAADKKVLMAHGSPDSIDEHIYRDTPNERLSTLAQTAKADVIIVGHSHEQFYRQVDGVSFVNPGSVGRPGDGNPQAAYALIGFNPFEVQLFRVDYNVVAAADALRKKGMPESLAQMLLCGVALDKILEEDQEKKNDMAQNCTKIAQICLEISARYWQDTGHCVQVRNVSLSLFDGLERLHKLGARERCWIECATLLHDVGLSQGAKKHHKKSMILILNETSLPFTSKERRIIASVARYHRKGLMKAKHFNLKTLTKIDLAKIRVLAGLLRVADALDYTHQAAVKKLNVKITPKKVTIECISAQESTLEPQAVEKKKDLFEEVFNKTLVLTWKRK